MATKVLWMNVMLKSISLSWMSRTHVCTSILALDISDGSGFTFSGSGRARAWPDYDAFNRAGSGFAFSGSGRARA